MRGRVDAARHAAGDDEPRRGELTCQFKGDASPRRRGLPATHHGDLRLREQFASALQQQQGGRIGKIGELRRKIAGGEGHELNALLPAPGQIRLDEFARRRCQRRRGFRRKPQRQQQPLRAAQQRLDAAG